MHILRDENNNIIPHGEGHDHEHTHEHVHADGTVHTHEHNHEGEHHHDHPHSHEHTHADGTVHTHDHIHEGEHHHHHDEHHHHHDEHHEETPLDELKAMLKYMVGHNAAHVKETEELAAQLKEAKPEVYELIAEAVEIYNDANAKLKEALDKLNA